MIKRLKTHFAVVVEVGVEAYAVSSGCLQVDQRRRVGVVLGKVHVELEAAVGVRRVGRTGDENLRTQRTQALTQANTRRKGGYSSQLKGLIKKRWSHRYQ